MEGYSPSAPTAGAERMKSDIRARLPKETNLLERRRRREGRRVFKTLSLKKPEPGNKRRKKHQDYKFVQRNTNSQPQDLTHKPRNNLSHFRFMIWISPSPIRPLSPQSWFLLLKQDVRDVATLTGVRRPSS